MSLPEKTYIQDGGGPLFHHVLQSDYIAASPGNMATLHYCFKPLWIGMRVLGMFPIHHSRRGSADFQLLSGAFNYSVAFFVVVGTYTAFVAMHRISFLRHTEGGFNALIFSYMCVVYASAYWFLPIGHWFGAKKVALYINDWTQFQVHCHKQTGVPLLFNTRQPILFWALATPFLILLLVAFEFIVLKGFTYWEAMYYVFIDTLLTYHFAAWYYICSALKGAALYLKVNLAGELRAHPVNQGVVPRYRALWEELSCLTRATGDGLCYTYGSIHIISFTILTCSVYGAISDEGSKNMSLKQIGLGFNAVLVFGAIFIVCNSAHLATEAMGDGFLSHLKQLKSQTKEVQRQLEQFQKAVCLDPPSISLGGYAVINRELLISLLAMIVTYLVVLLQFKASEVNPSVSLGANDTLTTFSP